MLKHTTLFLAVLAVTACHNIRDTDRKVDASLNEAESARKTMLDVRDADPDAVTEVRGRQYVNTTPIRLSRTLPSPCTITYKTTGPVSILEAGQTITKWCGVPVRVTQDALASINGMGGLTAASNGAPSNSQSGPQGIPIPAGVSLPPPPSAGGNFGMAATGSRADTGIQISYQGNAEGLLDQITSRYGLSWRVDRGTIVLFQTETRMFRIYNIPQSLTSQSVITSGNTSQAGATSSGGAGASGGSTGGVQGQSGSIQTTTLGMKTDPVEDLMQSTNKMLSGRGQAYYSASTSTLTVTDTPDVLDRVELSVQELNATYAKQVLVSAKILSITVSENDDNHWSLNAVYQSVANKYNVKLNNSYTAPDGAVSGAISILSGSSKWNGSQALVDALSTQGRVRVVTEPSVIARNMKPTPVQIARQTTYVASTTSTVTSGGTASGFAQTTQTPGTVTTGFNMNLLANVFPDNKTMELQLSINLSDLVSLVQSGSEGNTIGLPTIDQKMFNPDVQLQSGDVAVIAAYKQDSGDNERSGVGSASNWLLGGGISGKRQTTYVLIVLAPIVMTDKVPSATMSAAGGI